MRIRCWIGGHKRVAECGNCARCGSVSNKPHEWEGCTCKKCAALRDEGHLREKECSQCSRCGKESSSPHKWGDESGNRDICRCSKCGHKRDTRETKHDWTQTRLKCARCGKERTSEAAAEQEYIEAKEEIFDAVGSGEEGRVSAILARYPRLARVRDDTGWTLFHKMAWGMPNGCTNEDILGVFIAIMAAGGDAEDLNDQQCESHFLGGYKGDTPLHIAARRRFDEFLLTVASLPTYFEEVNVNHNLRNCLGKTWLDIAKEEGISDFFLREVVRQFKLAPK